MKTNFAAEVDNSGVFNEINTIINYPLPTAAKVCYLEQLNFVYSIVNWCTNGIIIVCSGLVIVQACRVKNKDTRPIVFILTCVASLNACYLISQIFLTKSITTKSVVLDMIGKPGPGWTYEVIASVI